MRHALVSFTAALSQTIRAVYKVFVNRFEHLLELITNLLSFLSSNSGRGVDPAIHVVNLKLSSF